MAEKGKKKLTLLLVGKSESGKSEFIRSFMAEDVREKLDIAGAGQTTRNFAEYELHCDKTDVTIQAKVKKKERFIRERLDALDAWRINHPALMEK